MCVQIRYLIREWVLVDVSGMVGYWGLKPTWRGGGIMTPWLETATIKNLIKQPRLIRPDFS